MIVRSVPTCRLDAVGSKPMYAVTCSLANASASPSVASDTRPRHCSSSHRLIITVVYEAGTREMIVSRRAALRTLIAGGVGTATGVGGYGYLYGRHELVV